MVNLAHHGYCDSKDMVPQFQTESPIDHVLQQMEQMKSCVHGYPPSSANTSEDPTNKNLSQWHYKNLAKGCHGTLYRPK